MRDDVPNPVDQAWRRPVSIGALRLPHRIVMGAMHLNLEDAEDGGAALAAFYAERAGAALIVTGGAAVNADGAGGPGYGILGGAGFEAALRRTAEAVHAAGGRIALQLFHAGRYALPGAAGASAEPLAPSAVYSRFARRTPAAMTEQQILGTVADFGRGAAAARELGFDAVEVMGSEGYLVNQFTAPLTNERDDAWGGDAERRRRFPVEVARAVRAAVGAEFPVLFRMSGADLVEGGTPEAEADALAVALCAAGVDALDIGVGWHESPVPTVQAQVAPGTWARTAARVKRALRAAGHGGVPVIASNRINRVSQAEEVLAGGDVDLVSMARPFLADAELVAKSAAGREDTVNVCLACNEACIDRSFGTEPVSCTVNPRAGRELEFPRVPEPAPSGRRFAVVGAGPAGLEAALTLARLGHGVDVYEAADEPGGQFRFARLVPGKEDFGATVRHHVGEIERLGGTVHLGRRIGFGDVLRLRALDGVVLATGVLPNRPELPGFALPQVLDYQEAFADPSAVGKRVAVVGGGGVAVDLARLLADGGGREVTLLRRSGRFGQGVGPSTRWVGIAELRELGVRMVKGVAYRGITRDGLDYTDADGAERTVAADTVVFAAGQESETDVAAVLDAAGVAYEVVGGAASVDALNAVRAMEEGLRGAHALASRPA